MKRSDTALPRQSDASGSSIRLPLTLLFAALNVASVNSYAEGFPFRVVYANVPGTEQIEAGNVELGIRLLEDQLEDDRKQPRSDVYATLCATYIVSNSLVEAQHACTRAVELGSTYPALNNRGVYRAFTGDLAGARDDFERARPRQLDAYIEELTSKDVRVIAAGNYQLINKLLAKYNPGEARPAGASESATIEDISDSVE